LLSAARMKAATIIGVLLIVLGLTGLVVRGIGWKTEEKVLDIGPIEATKEEHHSLPIPPIAGALALAGGVALVVVGSRSR
jgi:hypothetical protein